MTDSGITAIAKNLENGAAKFGGAIFYELAASPYQAAYQLADQTKLLADGKHLPPLEISKPDSSGWSTAGSFVGTVAKYALLSKVVHGAINPGETKAIQQTLGMTVRSATMESSVVGAAAGFLTPVEPGQNYWQEKGIKTVVSAGSFGIMGGTSAFLNKTSFMAEQKGSLTRAVAVNGIAGLLGGTSESVLDAALHHRKLDLQQTAINAGSYGLFGAAFGGTAHMFSTHLPAVEGTKPERVPEDDAPTKATITEHAQRALQTAQNHVSRIGNFIDNSLSQLIPANSLNFLNPMDGLQPAYARAGSYGNNARMPFRSPSRWTDGAVFSVAHEGLAQVPPRPQMMEFGGRGTGLGAGEPIKPVKPVRAKPPLESLEPSEKSSAEPIITPVNKLVANEPVVEAAAKPATKPVAEPVAESFAESFAEPVAKRAARRVTEQAGERDAERVEMERPSAIAETTGVATAKGYNINSVLSKTDRGARMNDVLATLNEEHPGFLRGLRAAHPEAMGGGRDSYMLKLVDGRYKNALLRFTTIFGQAQDTLTPTEWDPEWGKRPYDAPLLSKVVEVDPGGEDRVYVYVQEHGEGAINQTAATFDINEDASFARDASDPSFLQMMEELEQRCEEWVDPGSRQLVFSPLKGRLVLVDYPAVMRSSDIPQEWRDRDSGNVTSRPQNAYEEHNDANEVSDNEEEPNPYSHEVLDLSREEKRYNFLNRKGAPKVALQNEIAQQLFDGDSEKDMLPLIDFMFKDTLASLKMTAREAIKSTKEQLRKEGML